MGDLNTLLMCALGEGGKPCASMARLGRYVLPDGRVWEKGERPRPLCDACPEHDKPESQRHFRSFTIARHYAEDYEDLLDTLQNDPRYRKVADAPH